MAFVDGPGQQKLHPGFLIGFPSPGRKRRAERVDVLRRKLRREVFQIGREGLAVSALDLVNVGVPTFNKPELVRCDLRGAFEGDERFVVAARIDRASSREADWPRTRAGQV